MLLFNLRLSRPLEFVSESAPEPSHGPSQPASGSVAVDNQSGGSEDSEFSDTDNDDDLFKNTNHPPQIFMDSCSSEESDNC